MSPTSIENDRAKRTKTMTIAAYNIHLCYRFYGTSTKATTYEKIFRCKWSIQKASTSSDNDANSLLSGFTESIETLGCREELLEFVTPIQILHNYDDDATLRFELLSANKPSTASMVGERRSVEGAVRFRNLNDTLMWTSVDAVDCDVNAVVYRGRYSEDDDERRRANSVGKFTVTSENVYNTDISLNDAEVRMIVSISQLEKRGKMKHTDIETFLTIHRKSLAKGDYVIVYRSPKIMEVTSTSLHKFPEIIITREKLLGGANDRQIRFTLHSAANGDAIGEAEIFYSQLITDGKINLKLHSRDLNGNTLFGVSKRTLHHVGVLHVNAFLDSCTMSSSSRGSSSSTVSTTSTQESRVRSLKDDEEPKEKSNVMMASGRTQAYLISLLAPTVDIRLRPPFPNRSSEHLMDRSYYK